ncbi:MAG: YSIRK-type signal peptide-containing protein [Lactobacillus sp.]|jgi:LPXTG-motif cell wall-anchored protein|nr:YSIRK-type signal peptide-containing protein [Lactobacillus sp.]MCH3905522.1 YSIRK-type signal peptide-containing protein [Lactobacillus sp.]MCH3990910.1 YSIRK-type signal peptide-containing protein [Lactobacillus sp.]MCH4068374.1 YSIRK-type signal peptide-containing protein [Lactobacillus sp.]MCI1304387.1 YSIRK-type signal peptide-containing protein [Lactobacillus sp.]
MRKGNIKYRSGEIKNHFSIRKLTIGACSVLIGATLWMGAGNETALADSNIDAAVSVNAIQMQSETTMNTTQGLSATTSSATETDSKQTPDTSLESAGAVSSSEVKSADLNSPVTDHASADQSGDNVESNVSSDNTKDSGEIPIELTFPKKKDEPKDPNLKQIMDKLPEDQRKLFNEDGHLINTSVYNLGDFLEKYAQNVPDEVIQYLRDNNFFINTTAPKDGKIESMQSNSHYPMQRFIHIGDPNVIGYKYDINQTVHFRQVLNFDYKKSEDSGNIIYKYSLTDTNSKKVVVDPKTDNDIYKFPVYKNVEATWDYNVTTQEYSNINISDLLGGNNNKYDSTATLDEVEIPKIPGYYATIGVGFGAGSGIGIMDADAETEKVPADYAEPFAQSWSYYVNYSPIETKTEYNEKTITRTIHYQDEDGNKVWHPIYGGFLPDVKQEVTFSQPINYYKDPKTGKYVESGHGDWTATNNATFDECESLDVPGYTPDKKLVESEKIDMNVRDSTIVVTYRSNPQEALVKVVDDDNKGQELNSFDITNGRVNKPIEFDGFSEYVNNLVKNDGYYIRYTYDETNRDYLYEYDSFGKFDSVDKNVQKFTVHLGHRTIGDQTQSKVVKEIVHYVDENGKKLQDDFTDEKEFTRTGKKDLVTGNFVESSMSKWKPSFEMFGLGNLKIAGYTVDKTTIPTYEQLKVTEKSNDLEFTIKYKANVQKAIVQIVDDDSELGASNKVSLPATIEAEGQTSNPITFTELDEKMQALSSAGYELKAVQVGTGDPNSGMYIVLPKEINWNTLFGEYDSNDNNIQKFIIHLVHGRETKPASKTVSETIHYVYEDGSKAHEDAVQTVSFSRNIVTDKVTEKVIENESSKWTPNSQTFDAVASPVIAGYTPDYVQIAEKTVDSSAEAFEFTVTYKKNSSSTIVTPDPDPEPEPKPKPVDPDDPGYPTDPDQPIPDTPQEDPTVPEQGKTETVKRYADSKLRLQKTAKQKQAQAALPQTGAKKNNLWLAGLSLLTLGLFAGFGAHRKRDN